MMANKYNDVAVICRTAQAGGDRGLLPRGQRLFPENMRDQDQAVLAEVGRIAAAWMATRLRRSFASR